MATPIKETPEDRNARRTSISISSSQKTTGEQGRIIPRYLRASTGSCHDRCKHGMKDEWSESRSPTTRLGSRKRSVVKNKRVTRTVVPVERTKKTKTKPKPSPDPNICAPAEPVEVIKLEKSSPSKKVAVSKHSSSTNRKATQNELKMPKGRPATHVKAQPMMLNPSSSTLNASAGLNGQKNKKGIKTMKTIGMVPKSTSVEKVASKGTQTGLLPPKPSVSRAVSLKGSKQRNHKLVSPLKDQNRMTKTMLKQLIAEKLQEMALLEAETESEAKHETTELEFVPTTVEIIRSPPPLTTESTNLLNSESSPSSILVPVSVSSQSSSDKQVSMSESELEGLEEKCEYIHNNQECIIYEDDYEMETSEGIPRSYRVVICEDKDDEAVNLKFRRGKVLELLPEDNGPWRLKFRRGRVLEDNVDGQSIARITFKKKVVEARNDSNQGSENVTLKHQEVQEKKDVQELLNNVIEETASKLVEDMKTKVEALVGAFETVISLHDRPSSE